MTTDDAARFETESTSTSGPGDSDWAASRRRAAMQRARMLQEHQDAEHARACRIVGLFLRVAREEGLEDVPLRVRGYAGGSARTPLHGWYLRADEKVGIDTEGNYYVLSMPLSLRHRLRGVRPESQPVPMTIGEGGRDGDIVPLRFALDRLLPDWEERSPEPLVCLSAPPLPTAVPGSTRGGAPSTRCASGAAPPVPGRLRRGTRWSRPPRARCRRG